LSLSSSELTEYNDNFGAPDTRSLLTKTKQAIQGYLRPSAVNTPPSIDSFSGRMRQRNLDRREGVERVDRQLPGGPRQAEASAIAATRFSDLSANLAAVSFENGPIEYVGGSTPGRGYFRSNGKGGIVRPDGPLAELRKTGDEPKAFMGMAAARAERLLAEGREKKLTPQTIAKWKQYNSDPRIAAAQKEIRSHLDANVDLLVSSGILSKQQGTDWKSKDYLPFYRMTMDGSGNLVVVSPSGFQEVLIKSPSASGSALADVKKLKQLKGSDGIIGDPIGNIARNTFAITSMAMRNTAAYRAVRDGSILGYVDQVKGNHAKDKDVVGVWIDGKQKYFRIKDKLLYDSVMASGIDMNMALQVLSFPSKILRESVTSDPRFMVRNAKRDALQLWLQGYTSIPFSKILPSLREAVSNGPTKQSLENIGVLGSSIRGSGIDDTAANLRSELEQKGGAGKLNDARKKTLAASESIGRITVANEARKRGASEYQAAYEALEMLNFNRKGDAPWIRWISAMTPFLNARAQGADVLYRTATGKSVRGKDGQRALLNRSMYLIGLTTLYTLMRMGDEDYENMLPEERDQYFSIPIPGIKESFRIPIPFEAGIATKIIPERIINLTLGNDMPKDTLKSIRRAVMGIMELDIPQIVKPTVEASYNYDNFRQRNIVPQSLQRVEPAAQYDEFTSEIAKAIGGTSGLSPMKVDHVIKGYSGTMGVYALNLIDALMEPGVSPEIRPIEQPHTIPVIGGLFQRADGGRMLVDYYDIRGIAEEAAATLKHYDKSGVPIDNEKRMKLMKRASLLGPTQGIESRLSQLRKYRRQVESTNQITAKQKRDALDYIRQQEISLTRQVQPLRERIQ